MPRLKLSKRDCAKIVEVKRRCPCITQLTLAYIFDCSPARVGEIIRESKRRNRNGESNR
jgi:hypothetical protein